MVAKNQPRLQWADTMAVQGFFLSRTGLFVGALSVLVILPTILLKGGLESWYTDMFANPFTSFACIFILGAIAMNRYIRGNIVLSFMVLSGIAVFSYLYVWALLL